MVTGPDGRLFLEPVARFRIEPDLPDARLTLRFGADRDRGRPQPAVAFHRAGERRRSARASSRPARIMGAGEELTFSLEIPHRREATEIQVHWRGSGERGALRTVAAPLAVQIVACELALAPVAATPRSGVGSNG